MSELTNIIYDWMSDAPGWKDDVEELMRDIHLEVGGARDEGEEKVNRRERIYRLSAMLKTNWIAMSYGEVQDNGPYKDILMTSMERYVDWIGLGHRVMYSYEEEERNEVTG